MESEKGYQADSEKQYAEKFTPRSYIGRYYVLMVFSLIAAHQNTTWMTFGTIPLESKAAFGLTDDEITLLAAYGPIVFICLLLPFMWFLERAGLRITILTSAWMLAIGCGIRCFVPYHSKARTWVFLIHLGQMLNAAVGLPVMIAPPRISSVWFSSKQRTFATAITIAAQTFGISISFIYLPYLTRTYDLHTMLYVEAEIALFIAILASIYFPNQPPTPPSQTATIERIDFKNSMKSLLTNWSFLMLAISGGLIQGAVGGFSSVLTIILNKSGGFTDHIQVSSISEFFHSNTWLGATSSIACYLGGQIVGLFGYKLQKRFKISLIIFLLISIILGIWFSVSVYNYWHWSTNAYAYNIFATLCLEFFFSYATTPIYYEACAEATYPVPEGSSAGILSVLTNVFALVFQVIALCHIFSDDHPGRAKKMVWALAAITVISILPVFFYKEQYKRLKIDDDDNTEQDSENKGNIQSVEA